MVDAGDRQWKDAGFCHSRHRTASEKRGEAEEDAGVNQDLTVWKTLAKDGEEIGFGCTPRVSSLQLCAGWCPGDHAHSRTRPSDQRGDAVLPWEIPTVHVSIVWMSETLPSSRDSDWAAEHVTSAASVVLESLLIDVAFTIAASFLHHWVGLCLLWFAGRLCWLVAVTR